MKYAVLKKNCKYKRMVTPVVTLTKDGVVEVPDNFIPYSEIKVFDSKEDAVKYLEKTEIKKKRKKKA